MLEIDLELKLKKTLNQYGYAFKKSEVMSKDFPDRMILPPPVVKSNKGVVAFIELKKPGEEPRDKQLLEIERLRRRNIPATWGDDYETIMLWMWQLYNDARLLADVE